MKQLCVEHMKSDSCTMQVQAIQIKKGAKSNGVSCFSYQVRMQMIVRVLLGWLMELIIVIIDRVVIKVTNYIGNDILTCRFERGLHRPCKTMYLSIYYIIIKIRCKQDTRSST